MIIVNGAVSDALPATDRGLAYGDGVFRTLQIRSGRTRVWPEHYRKLEHDCAALGIACPEKALLADELARIAAVDPDCVVKIIVTRGTGQRGYAAAGCELPTRIVMSFPHVAGHAKPVHPDITARICTLRLGFQPALAGIKHLNRLENVLARREWGDADVAEGLLLDTEGNVIGGTMTNVFIVENDVLATPDLRRCGVAGVTRERILEHAGEFGLACRVENISVGRLLHCDEVFLTNSVIGVWQIRALADTLWKSGACTARVRQWLDEDSD